MALASTAILDAVVSHAQASGYFELVNGHEPANPPGTGITAGVWVQEIAAVDKASGLASTSALLMLNIRLYTPAIQEPADAVDPNMLLAVDGLMSAYNGHFTLGGLVMEVDVFGEFARGGLNARAGYIEQDRRVYRIFTISLPLVIADLWTQSA